jgi:hypothetical protein
VRIIVTGMECADSLIRVIVAGALLVSSAKLFKVCAL